MPHGSYSLGEAAARLNMLRLECPRCGRAGQYRVDKLLERYGPDIALPDLRHELARALGAAVSAILAKRSMSTGWRIPV